MHDTPTTISEWKSLAATSPEKAAQCVFDRIESLSDTEKRAVFSHRLSLESIAKSFQTSIAEQADQPLCGVPFLLKDLFDVAGVDTTASSTFLPEVRPTPSHNGKAAKAALNKGGVLAGKTHLNEFAYGLSGENPHFGDCPHPLFAERLSGGSSSGSAFAVKRGIVPIAFGTDTGGSIRVPAAWCGLYGLRLSPNAWSLDGCFPLAPTFDTAGWFCQTAEDMTLSMKALLPLQPSDNDSAPRGLNLIDACPDVSPNYRTALNAAVSKLSAETDSALASAFQAARQNIAKNYSVLQSLDALGVHREWLDPFKERYDPVVWQRVDRARHWSDQDIETAKAGETAIRSFFAQAFELYDYILLPATQSPAISAAAHTDPFRTQLLELTAPGSFARCPVLTLPVTLPDGESLGIQILYANEKASIPIDLLNGLA